MLGGAINQSADRRVNQKMSCASRLTPASCDAGIEMGGPISEMALENALKRLKKQYGPESVIHWHVSNTITVCNITRWCMILPTFQPLQPLTSNVK